MVEWVNQSEKWLQEHFRWFTRGISEAVGWALESLELFLLLQPWPVLVIVLVLPALAYGGLRLGLFTFFGVMFWGAVDMWDVAISTLSLMGVSVLLCVATGTVLGIVCSQNDRFEAMLRPVLDAMQVMPAFVYLVPAIFFFGLGGPSAAMAIIIYALPPMIRLTNLGIRQVSPQMIEAARAFGATPMQMLTKVQIPQAMPSIRLGVNQTIMMALALAVLATFIGAEGLGAEVWRAITRLKVGHSFEGGLCIVIMAVIFDRMSAAMNRDRARALPAGFLEFRLLPQKWDSHPAARVVEIGIDRAWNAVGGACTATARGVGRLLGALAALVDRSMQIRISAWCARRGFLVTGLILIAAVLVIDAHLLRIGDYPREWEISIREPIDKVVADLTVYPPFIAVTQWIRAAVYLYLLAPLDRFLVELPWFYVAGLVGLIVWRSVGLGFAVVTTVALFFVGAADLWAITMYTLAGTTVSVVICMVIGIPLGIAAAHSRVWDAIQRPVLDTMQTMPAFVYLIPVLFFFGGNPTTAIIATVIYALPPMTPVDHPGNRPDSAGDRRGRPFIRFANPADADQGEVSARDSFDHARGQPDRDHGSRDAGHHPARRRSRPRQGGLRCDEHRQHRAGPHGGDRHHSARDRARPTDPVLDPPAARGAGSLLRTSAQRPSHRLPISTSPRCRGRFCVVSCRTT